MKEELCHPLPSSPTPIPVCRPGSPLATASATIAAQAAGADHRPLWAGDLTVVDSRSLSMGQGFMVLAAAEAAQAGASRDEIVAHALAVGERAYLYAALSTLKYLAMRVAEARRDGERGWFPRVPRVPNFRVQEKQVRASLPCPEAVLTAELTPGLSVHSGAGLVGVVVVAGSGKS
ncbi:MAG: DegV family protein [Anaerolineae bacterium]|nr:DegV family protein [Anaerolineae bacterium]